MRVCGGCEGVHMGVCMCVKTTALLFNEFCDTSILELQKRTFYCDNKAKGRGFYTAEMEPGGQRVR